MEVKRCNSNTATTSRSSKQLLLLTMCGQQAVAEGVQAGGEGSIMH
jgi:hypothetical protein